MGDKLELITYLCVPVDTNFEFGMVTSSGIASTYHDTYHHEVQSNANIILALPM